MKRAIREHLRDFIAIVALIIAGLVTAGVILSSQAAARRAGCPSSAGPLRAQGGVHLGPGHHAGPGPGRGGRRDPDRRHHGRGAHRRHAVVEMEIEDEYAP